MRFIFIFTLLIPRVDPVAFTLLTCTLAVTPFKDVVPGCAFPPLSNYALKIQTNLEMFHFMQKVFMQPIIYLFLSQGSVSLESFVLENEASDLAGISIWYNNQKAICAFYILIYSIILIIIIMHSDKPACIT